MNDDQRVDYPAPRLWNPNVAANWSLLFSPIFGAWVHAKNWKELGDYEKAKKSMLWVYGYTIFTVIVSFVPDFPNISVIGITVFWYTSFAKEQINYVKSGKNYEKKSWLAPILLAIVGIFILLGVIGALRNATISKDDLRSTALDLLNDSQMESGTGFTCLSITKLEEQSDGSYHAIAEFSDGDKVKIMIKNEFLSVNVQVIEDIVEDDLLINTVMRLVDQIMIDNNVDAQCVSVSDLVKLENDNYNATATLVNGEVVKINIERNSEQIYVTIIESSPET